MKRKTTGRRFSKVETITIEPQDSIQSAQSVLLNIGENFGDKIKRIRTMAETVLTNAGLPCAPILFMDGDLWTDIRPKIFQGSAHIGHYVTKKLGKDHDSLEGIAARIIDNADTIETKTGDIRDAAIFEIGRLYQLGIVYGIDISSKSKGGKHGGGQNCKVSDKDLLLAYNRLQAPKYNRATILGEHFGISDSAIRQRLKKLL
ncbi:MAG: hypothetical protein JXA04_10705 [Gammaproteobacteria bacterium]|nr:hypothetical protein [Gammaproteobacteria bacterium]